jgi:hypothetical protein
VKKTGMECAVQLRLDAVLSVDTGLPNSHRLAEKKLIDFVKKEVIGLSKRKPLVYQKGSHCFVKKEVTSLPKSKSLVCIHRKELINL